MVRPDDPDRPGPFAENVAQLAHTRCHLYPEYIRKILPHLEGTRADKLRVFLRFETTGKDHSRAITEIAMGLYGDPSVELEEIRSEMRAVVSDDLAALHRGLGPWLRAKFPGDVPARVRFAQSLPPEIAEPLIEGVGAHGIGMVATADRVEREVRMGLESGFPEPFFVGLGRRLREVRGDLAQEHYFEANEGPWMFWTSKATAFAHRQPPKIADALQRGFDSARASQRVD